MKKIISQLYIKDLLSKIDIIDLINTKINLKKQGKNFSACCPFHFEKTPSFTVNREKQFFYCFGCGIHGNVIDFLIKYDNLEFIECIEELSCQYGLILPYSSVNKKNSELNSKEYFKRRSMYFLMNKLCLFYKSMLKTNLANLARYYLRKRGFSEFILDKFFIGFAPFDKNNIIKYSNIEKKHYFLLNESGMLSLSNDGSSYDRFRNRIMFPIKDKFGRVIAFGGRSVEKNHPKYLNSPETNIFRKSYHLYGLYEAKQQNIKLSKLLVVEGYMDVIALAQFGIYYSVATLGSTLSEEHVKLLYSNAEKIIFCYDGDRAGKDAAWRSLKIFLPYLKNDKQLSFMFLPEGEDPDTLIRKIGKKKFETLIEKSIELPAYFFDTLLSQLDMSKSNSKIKLSKLALPLINKINDNILRFYLKQQLGIKIGVFDDNQLEKLFKNDFSEVSYFHYKNIKYTKIRVLISLLIQYPKLHVHVPTPHFLENVSLPGVYFFIQLVNVCKKFKFFTTGQLLEYYRNNKFYCYLKMLAVWNHMISNEIIEETFIEILKNLYDCVLEKRQNILLANERKFGLTKIEREEFWLLNKTLSKK